MSLKDGRTNHLDFEGSFSGHAGEGNGNPLQYSCLENPMDRGAWCPWGHKESDMTEWLHFHLSPLAVMSAQAWWSHILGEALPPTNPSHRPLSHRHERVHQRMGAGPQICHAKEGFDNFQRAGKWKWKLLNRVWLFATPWTIHSLWNSPGQNTGVGSLSLLQGIFPTQGSNPGLPCCRWILYQLSQQGSPRKLEWVAYPFSSGSSWPRNRTEVSCIAGRFFTSWATREALAWC